MVLDECLAHPATDEAARARRWSGRCAGRAAARERFLALRDGLVPGVTVTNPGQAQFGIVQGGVFPGAARGERAGRRSTIGFEAYAIGGLSVGEPTDVMYDMVGAHDAAACRPIGRAT